ncbi:MAG: class I SAM-dependent methyltransferase [Pseudomonadota bacterium]
MSQTTFWDGVARSYAARPVRDQAAYEATLTRVRSYLSATDRVLELGCGTGSTALLLASSVARYMATDISGEMIAIAREKGVPDNVTFTQAAIETAEAGEAVDVILAFNLLHLVNDIPRGLADIARRLPQGGRFISKTPCLGYRRWLFAPLIGALRLIGKAPHVHLLTPDTLEQHLRDAGFKIIETGDYPAAPPSRFIVAEKRG